LTTTLHTLTNPTNHPPRTRSSGLLPGLVTAAFMTVAIACGGNRAAQQNVTPPPPPPTVKPISVFAGSPGGWGAVDGSGAEARFTSPGGMCFDSQGQLLVADISNGAIRKVDPASGETSTWAGRLASDGMMDGYLPDARFAATGDPNGGALPLWTSYDAASQFYLEFGDQVESRRELLKAQCDFFDKFYAAKRAKP